MTGHVKVGGAWKALDGLHVKVGGAWKAVNNGYVKVSGAWKEFYAAGAFLLDLADNLFDSLEEHGSNTTGTLNVRNTGEIIYTGDYLGTNESGHTWFSPIGGTDGTGWHVKLSYTSGTNQYSSGAGLAAWLACTSHRAWTFLKSTSDGPNSTSGVYLLEFSDDAGATTYASVSINDITLTEQSP